MTVKEKAELIVKDIKKEQGTNPVVIFKQIAEKEYVSIHGPEHHILDGASLLVAYKNAALAVVLFFLAVEEKRHVKPVFRKRHRNRYRYRDSLICRAVKHGFFIAQLFKIRLCVKFAQFSYLVACFNFACVYKIGDFSAAFGGEIAEFKHTGTL